MEAISKSDWHRANLICKRFSKGAVQALPETAPLGNFFSLKWTPMSISGKVSLDLSKNLKN